MRNKKLAVVVVIGIILMWGYFHFKNKAEIKEKNIKERIELQEFLKEYNSTLEEKRELVKKMESGEIEVKYKIGSNPGKPEREKLPIIPYTKDLPPVPNEEENNSTIFGVDVNKNGVRDDLEILTVKIFGEDENLVEAEFAAIRARSRASLISIETHSNNINFNVVQKIIVNISKYIDCISYYGKNKSVQEANIIYKKQYNTLERKELERKVVNSLRGGGGHPMDRSDKNCKAFFEETRHYEYFNKN